MSEMSVIAGQDGNAVAAAAAAAAASNGGSSGSSAAAAAASAAASQGNLYSLEALPDTLSQISPDRSPKDRSMIQRCWYVCCRHPCWT